MSDTKHLSYFKVENFKCFESFEMDNIGQFNLIVGDNNIGKTSLLEALLVDENGLQLMTNLLNTFYFRNIFFNVSKTIDFIKLLSRNKNTGISYSYQFRNEKNINVLKAESVLLKDISKEDIEKIQSKILINPGRQDLIRFEFNGDINYEFVYFGKLREGVDNDYMPFIPFALNYKDDLVDYFSTHVQISTQLYNEVIAELRLFVDSLISIEITSENIYKQPLISLRLENKDDLVLLGQYGDGTSKFFRILMELYVTSGKRLMIDEVDSGIHYSKFKEFWKAVITSAQNNNVQLFMTTHSLECIKYYKEALSELGEKMQDKARLIHLAKVKDGSIKAYNYNFNQFSSNIELENEMRS